MGTLEKHIPKSKKIVRILSAISKFLFVAGLGGGILYLIIGFASPTLCKRRSHERYKFYPYHFTIHIFSLFNLFALSSFFSQEYRWAYNTDVKSKSF